MTAQSIGKRKLWPPIHWKVKTMTFDSIENETKIICWESAGEAKILLQMISTIFYNLNYNRFEASSISHVRSSFFSTGLFYFREEKEEAHLPRDRGKEWEWERKRLVQFIEVLKHLKGHLVCCICNNQYCHFIGWGTYNADICQNKTLIRDNDPIHDVVDGEIVPLVDAIYSKWMVYFLEHLINSNAKWTVLQCPLSLLFSISGQQVKRHIT